MRHTITALVLVLGMAAPSLSGAEEPSEWRRPSEWPDEMDWEEKVEQAMEFVAAEDPELARELGELRVHDPDAFMREVFQIMLEKKELERLSKSDQQRYLRALKERELDRKSHRLAREWHEAAEDEREDLRAELHAVLGELFDVREWHRSEQIAELERELERLRSTLKARQENKKSIVDSRLKEMLGEEDHLRW